MTIQELLIEMANQGTIEIRVKADRPTRHSKVTTGTVEKITTKGVGVRMDGVKWNAWFRTDKDSNDKRSRYIRELKLINKK